MTTTTGGPSGRTRPGPSIGDVARLAGLSQQTVSRVANGADNVRPATRDRVLAAMDQLGYSPNHAARALRSGSFRTIGVIAHRLSRTGEGRTIEAVVEAARVEGFTVSLVDVASPSQTDMADAAARLTHQAIDGLIIIRAEDATPASLALPPRMPVVVSDSRFIGHLPAVGADQAAGTTTAVQHLLDLGHRTVHHVRGPLDSGPAQIRADAWAARLRSAGRPVPEPVVGDWTSASGYAAGQRLVLDPEVTAVLCANDEMAAGLMLALHEGGRRVPEDVSVIGYDDIPLAPYLWPPLTSVNLDFHTIGQELVTALLTQMRGGVGLSGHHVLVPTRLVVRSSTAAPHG
ncbi:LacI family transcriptional regulator [Serinibacter arcticus]|uniref:LacI family transcriptional regulator n=1 Tax=Serinibacter arcticus TaxID=1655435 RepID=A0A2U1ZVL6_9MICO|nr:LacI family DNA-binding transcriptional regulator [Serinibacter arcticus]PWD51011.1 LacI family transcriptional regulator [Serinibacter arcticus]